MTILVAYLPNVRFHQRAIQQFTDYKAFRASMLERPDLVHEEIEAPSEAEAIHRLEVELVGSDEVSGRDS